MPYNYADGSYDQKSDSLLASISTIESLMSSMSDCVKKWGDLNKQTKREFDILTTDDESELGKGLNFQKSNRLALEEIFLQDDLDIQFKTVEDIRGK